MIETLGTKISSLLTCSENNYVYRCTHTKTLFTLQDDHYNVITVMTRCDVPHCDHDISNSGSFDHDSVTCWECEKSCCAICTSAIWSGSFDSRFTKPRVTIPGLVHQTFTCPFCRATFDRIVSSHGDCIL